MAANRFKPNAPAVAQVATITISAYDAATTYKVTRNGKTISVLGSGGTTATVATALQAALAAASSTSYPEFAEVTWTVNSSTITATNKTAGAPATFTTSVSGGTGTIGAFTVTTTSTGANDWASTGDWSLGAVPVSTNDVYVEQSSVPIFYGLSQSGVTLNSLNIAASYTSTIGLPETNANGSATYLEDRPTYLAIGATTCVIGDGVGSGPTRVKLDFGSVQTACVVRLTGASAEFGLEPVLLKGTHVANVVEVIGNSTVAIAGYGDEVATVATLRTATGAVVRCGAGATLTTLNMSGGTVEINSAITTVQKDDGDLTVKGTGAVTTLTDLSGTTTYQSTGTITTCTLGSAATFDRSQDIRPMTITTLNMYAGSTLLDPFGTITFTNPIHLVECKIGDVTIDLGPNRNLAPT